MESAASILRDVGLRVAELRRTRHLTQEAFAERIDVTVHYLQRIEAGRENLTVRSLMKLAKGFRVPFRELFDAPQSRRAKPGRPRSLRTN